LKLNSPFIYTTDIHEEYQSGFRRKSQKIKAAWIYHYEFNLNGENYTGASSLPEDIYNIGDTIKVFYLKKNPMINKILIKD
jgi:hypothetical protein